MQENWLWGFDQFIGELTNKGKDMNESTVSTKYMYERIHEILDMDESEDVAYSLSRLMDELANNYKTDTGELIGQRYHKHNCPAKDGFGCRGGEDL